MANIYVMPDVRPGDIVYWYADAHQGGKPYPSIVTEVGERNVALSVLHSGVANMDPRDGVRHLADPEKHEDAEAGAWSHRPEEPDKRERKVGPGSK